MKNLNHEFKTNVRKPALFLVCLFLLSFVMLSFAACGSDPADTSSSDDIFSSDKGIAAPSDENGVISDESDVVVTNSDGDIISGDSEGGSSSAGTGSSSDKPSSGKPSSGNSSNSGSLGGGSSNSGSSGSSSGGNSGSSSNTKPTKPIDRPTKPSEPVVPSEPEVPAVKDSITRMPEIENLMWKEINRRRVAGGVSAFNHCNSCETTANKQAQFNAEYLKFEYMSHHAASECGGVIWNRSINTSATEVATTIVDGWWESAGHRANFMDASSVNGGISVYRVVRNGQAAYLSIFHFDSNDAFGCSNSFYGMDYCKEFMPEALYKR